MWSASAAIDAWVEWHILFAQRFTKQIVAVALDTTELPNTLHVSLALPASERTDPLLTLYQQATHAYISQRKEAIDQAAAMLQSYFCLNVLVGQPAIE